MPVEPPLSFDVAERRQETHDTWTLRLQARAVTADTFAPGQFAMLYAFGAGEVPISVSEIGSRRELVHTVRVVGAVTGSLCRADTVGVRGPFGRGWPLAEAEGRDVVIVAGGLGLAPLRPVVHTLLADRDRYGRVSVLCGGRSPAELLYRGELEEWRRNGLCIELIVDAPDRDWRGHVGVVPRLIRRARFDPARTTAMLCGPEVMMRFSAAALREHGVPATDVWLSMERSMKCATGHCGHCQLGPEFVCKDGPVFRYDHIAPLMEVAEL